MQRKKKIGVVIADNHRLYQKKIKEVIASQERDIQVLAELNDELNIVDTIGQVKPDLLILDMDSLIGYGVQTIKSLRKQYKQLRVLVLKDDLDPAYWEIAYLAGASGVLNKDKIVYDLGTFIETIFDT